MRIPHAHMRTPHAHVYQVTPEGSQESNYNECKPLRSPAGYAGTALPDQANRFASKPQNLSRAHPIRVQKYIQL